MSVSNTTKRVKEIRRKTRRKFSSEEKIRIVLEGLRGECSIAELCRREGINANLYYRWTGAGGAPPSSPSSVSWPCCSPTLVSISCCRKFTAAKPEAPDLGQGGIYSAGIMS